ncbi:MAG: hypothetical protein HY260_07010, partial [Chloroflexi bacterium]|nr:hypothetical protein [Chloroflexota bacterium]
LTTNIDITHQPIGWGPYVITEWVVGESTKLARNPRYFRAAEGLPRIDALTFRFVPDAASALTDLTAGKCDVVLHDSFGRKQADLIPAIDAAAAQGGLVAQYAADASWEHLDFNLSPADDRTPFFADPAVRRAVALCLDRKALADAVYPGHGVVAASLVPQTSPYFAADAITQYQYDPAAGRDALAAAGWQDGDGDGIVEKESTPLTVELTLQSGTPDEKVSALIARDLSACGLGVTPRFVSGEQISGVGATSPIFRRQFDLALFAWRGALSGEPQCELYASSQIPTEENNWRGSNTTAYTNRTFDLACQSAREATSFAVGLAAYQETQRIFTADLPSLPLFHRLQWLVARPGVSGLTLDGIALDDLRSELTLIEELTKSELR